MIHESAGDAVGYIRRYLEAQADAHTTVPAAHVVGPACNLCETLEWLVQRYEMQLEARGMRLSAQMPAAEACVAIEGLVLRQVTENLVTNAIKYAAHGGEIEFAARAGAPGYWQLRVVRSRRRHPAAEAAPIVHAVHCA